MGTKRLLQQKMMHVKHASSPPSGNPHNRFKHLVEFSLKGFIWALNGELS